MFEFYVFLVCFVLCVVVCWFYVFISLFNSFFLFSMRACSACPFVFCPCGFMFIVCVCFL